MQINRQKLLAHLQRLHCGGQINEVVFTSAFASNALTPDTLLLVIAPSIPEVEGLKEEIGVAGIKTLMSALQLLKGDGNIGVEVNVYVLDGEGKSGNKRLVIDDGDRGVQELIICSPKTVGTRIEQDLVDQILADAPKSNSIPLTRAMVEGVRGSFSLYKAEEIEIHVGPQQSEIVVGTSKTNRARFPFTSKSKKEYQLVFKKHLIDVLSVITDYSAATLRLGGPDHSIMIEDAGFKFLISPYERGADEEIKSDAEELSENDGTPEDDEKEEVTPVHKSGAQKRTEKKRKAGRK